MKRIFLAAALAGGLVAPAFAQDAATMVCSDYAAMDNAGKQEMLAELQAMNSEMSTSQNLSSDEIAAGLNDGCATKPDALVSDVMKEMHKM